MVSPEEERALEEASRRLRLAFFDPLNHVRLAWHYHELGLDIVAFRILRLAQERHFTPLEFFNAYGRVFGGPLAAAPPLPPDEALERSRLATEEHPGDAEAWWRHGRILAARRGLIGNAVEALQRACRLAPDDGRMQSALAAARARSGDLEGAISGLEAFLETHDADVEATAELAELLRTRSPAQARSLVRDALERRPNAARLHLALAYLTVEDGADEARIDAARHSFRMAAELAPDDPVMLAWYALMLMQDEVSRPQAFELYMKAWFLDPRVRERVDVYKRLTTLIEDFSASVLARATSRSEALVLFDDLNPMVALGSWSMAFQLEGCDPDVLEIAFRQLAHEDEAVRYQAARYISERAPASVRPQIEKLLEHPDVYVRGLALYIAISRWQEGASAAVRAALRSPNDYLRFEALSALRQLGGDWGQRLLAQHMRGESHPHLRRVFGRR